MEVVTESSGHVIPAPRLTPQILSRDSQCAGQVESGKCGIRWVGWILCVDRPQQRSLVLHWLSQR